MNRTTKLVAGLAVALAFTTALHAEDWPMWGRTPDRHMISPEKNPPTDWDIESGKHIKWVAQLGSQSYGNPVIANGLVIVGTNNEAKRDPAFTADAGVLKIFRESDGKFLYQRVSPKLKAGRVNDWPYQGICSTPVIEGDLLYYATSRCEVVCLDLAPLRNGTGEPRVVWEVDMMATLGVFPHNMTSCSPVIYDDMIYIITGNGVDETHKNVPQPKAPAIVAFNKKTGALVWSDNAPLANVLHGQWASPAIAVVDGKAQVICPLGDSLVRSYDAKTGKLLWSFDTNLKETIYPTTRNELISTPVIYKNRMYLPTGQDPEHGEGPGHMWVVDITKESNGGDISLELPPPEAAPSAGDELLVPKNLARSRKGIPNPNSAVIWHYNQKDQDGNGRISRSERMNRTISTVAISDGIAFVPDFSGFLHAFDAETGERLWVHDMEAAMWGSPLIADGKLYLCDEDGDVTIFKVSRKLEVLAEHNMDSASYCSPVLANGTLYIMTREKLYAISDKK